MSEHFPGSNRQQPPDGSDSAAMPQENNPHLLRKLPDELIREVTGYSILPPEDRPESPGPRSHVTRALGALGIIGRSRRPRDIHGLTPAARQQAAGMTNPRINLAQESAADTTGVEYDKVQFVGEGPAFPITPRYTTASARHQSYRETRANVGLQRALRQIAKNVENAFLTSDKVDGSGNESNPISGPDNVTPEDFFIDAIKEGELAKALARTFSAVQGIDVQNIDIRTKDTPKSQGGIVRATAMKLLLGHPPDSEVNAQRLAYAINVLLANGAIDSTTVASACAGEKEGYYVKLNQLTEHQARSLARSIEAVTNEYYEKKGQQVGQLPKVSLMKALETNTFHPERLTELASTARSYEQFGYDTTGAYENVPIGGPNEGDSAHMTLVIPESSRSPKTYKTTDSSKPYNKRSDGTDYYPGLLTTDEAAVLQSMRDVFNTVIDHLDRKYNLEVDPRGEEYLANVDRHKVPSLTRRERRRGHATTDGPAVPREAGLITNSRKAIDTTLREAKQNRSRTVVTASTKAGLAFMSGPSSILDAIGSLAGTASDRLKNEVEAVRTYRSNKRRAKAEWMELTKEVQAVQRAHDDANWRLNGMRTPKN